jgi:hypothetical protein
MIGPIGRPYSSPLKSELPERQPLRGFFFCAGHFRRAIVANQQVWPMNLSRLYAEQLCPVCGFKLGFVPWQNGMPADKPCPCCGIHFGYDDANESSRANVYLTLRQRWISDGRRWWSADPVPPEYNPPWQLARVQTFESAPIVGEIEAVVSLPSYPAKDAAR